MSQQTGPLAILSLVALAPLLALQHESMPPGMSHEEHMKQRGNQAMGFAQDKATHHFYLTRTGGRIEVSANQAADEATRNQVRDHLRAISRQFAGGVFTS